MDAQPFQSPFDVTFDYSSLLGEVQPCLQNQDLPLISALSAEFTQDLSSYQAHLEQPLVASGTTATLGNHQTLGSAPILPHPGIYLAQP